MNLVPGMDDDPRTFHKNPPVCETFFRPLREAT